MDALDRMFHVLVKTLRDTNPALLTSPFSVSDLHQQILPYRHFRRELGLETNQEYEYTLMQLLSGARGYLEVDERLSDGLQKELTAGAPEPSRVRDYADAQVSLNPSALAAMSAGTGAGAARPTGGAIGSKTATLRTSSGTACRYCGGELPVGRATNFCPHCGQNLQIHNCPGCGAEVEAGWKFCVACGKTVT